MEKKQYYKGNRHTFLSTQKHVSIFIYQKLA